ncbi:hypothetical protein [Spirosoma pollinicola]|uniref:Uncharacterized protein n=1 Tax=Spirosoma pollinicola TaxID=2057025 RepID=A0A2K8ZA53_9BACT|nr:hypothetical protein [Spirosoma pollinicola]AUD06753.1 hypothetical protein CWM47_35860 [Spirosoma pollinicola]
MLSLADTTELLDQTTTQLMGESDALTPQAGIALIEAWLAPLQAGENTRPLADQLVTLKTLLAANPVDESTVREMVGPLAEQLTFFSTQMGGEGEMPALLEGLSTALRQASTSSKADTANSMH